MSQERNGGGGIGELLSDLRRRLQAHIICMRNLIQRRDETISRVTDLVKRVAIAEPMAAAGKELRDFVWNEMKWNTPGGRLAVAVAEYDKTSKRRS